MHHMMKYISIICITLIYLFNVVILIYAWLLYILLPWGRFLDMTK